MCRLRLIEMASGILAAAYFLNYGAPVKTGKE
jgi:hypothetical protein